MTCVCNDVHFVFFVFFVVNDPVQDSDFPNNVTDGFDLLLGHAREDRQ